MLNNMPRNVPAYIYTAKQCADQDDAINALTLVKERARVYGWSASLRRRAASLERAREKFKRRND